MGEAGQEVLDIGCGTGHYTQAFAEAGFSATGIDLNGDMIDAARKKYPHCRFRVMDMREISRLEKKFNLIFALGNVVAHLPGIDLNQFLEGVKSCLAGVGLWIFQTVNWDYILAQRQYTFPVKRIETTGLVFHREYDPLSSDKVMFKTSLKSGNDILFTDSAPLYPVTSADYIRLHREIGFKMAGHYADFHKNPYSSSDDKANIMVHQKKS